MTSLEKLRYHVSGAIERGEGVAVIEQPSAETVATRSLRAVQLAANTFGTSPCKHDWQPTDHGLIDRCAVCGEERA